MRTGYDELILGQKHFKGFQSQLFVDAKELTLCFWPARSLVSHVQGGKTSEAVRPFDKDGSWDDAHLVDPIAKLPRKTKKI